MKYLKLLLPFLLLTGCLEAQVQCYSDTKLVYWKNFNKTPYVGQVGNANDNERFWCIDSEPNALTRMYHWCDVEIRGDNVNCITVIYGK